MKSLPIIRQMLVLSAWIYLKILVSVGQQLILKQDVVCFLRMRISCWRLIDTLTWNERLMQKYKARSCIKYLDAARKIVMVQMIVVGALISPMAMAGLSDVIQRVKPSVIGVGTSKEMRAPTGRLFGTGFVVGDGLHVLTNAHVVSALLDIENGESLVVFVGRGVDAEMRTAEKVAVDASHDLALLKISGAPLPSIKLDYSLPVREGDLFAFTGFPIGSVLGLYPVTHRGIVSAITPIVAPMDNGGQLVPAIIKRLRSAYDVYQLDATAYPGNSGSPMYDVKTGRVVAVINMVFVKETKESLLSSPSGITYAIPIKYAQALLRKNGLKP